jgi:hypothetical protein
VQVEEDRKAASRGVEAMRRSSTTRGTRSRARNHVGDDGSAEKVETRPVSVLGRRPWHPAAASNGARAGEGEVTDERWRCMLAVGARAQER